MKHETELRALLERALALVEPAQAQTASPLTIRVCQELIEHEGIVLEAYRDSACVWTWGIGVTDRSGHLVGRYKDAPSTIERVFEIFVWLLENVYVPPVLREFEGYQLTEAQFAAALSFNYNTGAIGSASWPNLWKLGKIDEARASFLSWRKPVSIIPRREKEVALFFEGTWSQDDLASVIPVRKPSYRPNFAEAVQIDIAEHLRRAMA